MKQPVISIDILVVRNNLILLGLLTERWSNEGKLTYGLPGREILFGETFGEAVKRNIREELGCGLKDYSVIAVNANYALNNHYIGVGVIAEIDGEPKVTKPEDWQKWEWFSLDNLPLPANLFPPAQNLIDSYKSGAVTVSD
jgi:ADP-ribose pyrophosphatase YjhB (NUDIX family)